MAALLKTPTLVDSAVDSFQRTVPPAPSPQEESRRPSQIQGTQGAIMDVSVMRHSLELDSGSGKKRNSLANTETEAEAATRFNEKVEDLPDDTTLTGKEDNTLEEKNNKDPNEVGFDGPDDSFNPLNQPVWRKWVSVFTVASGAICV
ncbi:hypothetical protein QFC19_008939 [Naganishia cerealis]|uniref:Uncharacterized protein n=1 Tax=Naganishia cerealis TaxID=610337 RepID=A0ACC2UZB5_9TREE|nr:hypothetical protein QFC19_008939 [Naganishia cerealis]